MTTNLRQAFGEIAARQAQRAAAELDARDRDRQRMRVSDAPHWYVGHASSDGRAKDRLSQAKMEFYYPVVREFRRTPRDKLSHAQRRSNLPMMKELLRPLFRNYFFLRFDLRDGTWHETFELAGISGLIADASSDGALMPAPISGLIIAEIKAREVGGAIPGNAKARKIIPFVGGDEVMIDDGSSMQGVRGTVFEVSGHPVEELNDRVLLKLLVSMFGRMTVVELPVTSILRADRESA